MALTFTKEVGKYVIGGLTGTGITLASLLAWTGATDLQEIKSSVQSYVTSSEQQASALLGEYNVLVDNANAEIGTYQQALERANSNIDQLIEKYNTDQATLNATITDLQQQLEASQGEVANLVTQAEANEIIAKANDEIGQANTDVAQAKTDVNDIISKSKMSSIASGEKSKLDTEGDKSVTSAYDILGLQLDMVQNIGKYEKYKTYDVLEFTFNDGTTFYIAPDLYGNGTFPKYVATTRQDNLEDMDWRENISDIVPAEHKALINEYLNK